MSTRDAAHDLAELLDRVRGCDVCAEALPHDPRPVLRGSVTARVLVVGQAPGAKVHESGVPWADASGEHLCEWLGISHDALLDTSRFAILPMGFCWPGRRAGGDLPPRSECAPLWHGRVREHLPNIRLTLLVGSYAVDHYLSGQKSPTLTETVRRFDEFLPTHLPLPHPSWRSRHWMKRNPWFATDVVPELRHRVARALSEA